MLELSPAVKPVLDVSGASLDFLSVILFIFACPWAWPLSMLAILVNSLLYWGTGLFADTWLQGVYFISAIYGWYYWLRGGEAHQEAVITRIAWRHGLVLSLLSGLSFVLLFLALTHWHSKVPFWDAATTVLSLTAQWLACRKILESWMVWFVVDVMYALLYTMKGIPAHALVYGIYTILAIIGYRRWRRQFSL